VIKPENRNILWATILADELARCGVRHAVIAPGSRSTPLAVAFSRDERFTIHSIIDERAAAFFTLGIGKASGMPAVVVCTSGTAAANFFPAIIEASMSNVPMIVMTADRPHELRDSGANQTIDQVKLYGGYVRWFVDVAPPHANPEDKTLRYLRTTMDRAVAYSQGTNGGPVHLNVPFEKPLEPVIVEGDTTKVMSEGLGRRGHSNPLTYISKPILDTDDDTYEWLIRTIGNSTKGLIICGPNSFVSRKNIEQFALLTGFPILADGASGLRLYFLPSDTDYLIGGYETFLRNDCAKCIQPDLIICLGESPTGSALLSFLSALPSAPRILITESGQWKDEFHLLSDVIHADPTLVIEHVCYALTTNSQRKVNPTWQEGIWNLERITWEITEEFLQHEACEGNVLTDIVSLLSPNSSLIVASSNPIRHLDQFVQPQAKDIFVFANRGVSGIDGTVATALGVGKVHFSPPVLVIGDLALYHDLNSLHLIRRLNIPLVIVCINNDGGGIFHRLPIANYDPPFRNLFVTPHGLTFEHAAKMFDIPYTLASMGEDLRTAFKAALDSGEPHLIEVPSNAAEFERQRKQLIDTVAQRIAESGILEKFKTSQEKHSQGSTPA
jgi:2-succinyl-5-enolpyruvyl-6-hydroxy-3-cyclohexene-1-carboxylate synthase